MGIFDILFKKMHIEPKQEIKRGFVSVSKAQLDDNTVGELKKKYIAFDVETTGLSPINDRIIEVGAVIFENGDIKQRYETLINPEVSISSSATAVNNITNYMIMHAPLEEKVYLKLINFLGDAINEQTVICAHNARFDMGFLAETLMRLGYSGKIRYVDTLSLSRELIKDVENYKQDTISKRFAITNAQAHRAISDAEVCGKIFWELLKLTSEGKKQIQEYIKISRPSNEEMEVCAFIQNCITKYGGEAKYLNFTKNSNDYVDVSYVYTIIKFKLAKQGKYIIVDKKALGESKFTIATCVMSEGGVNFARVYFDNPLELEPLSDYFYNRYQYCKQSIKNDYKYSLNIREYLANSVHKMNGLSEDDVKLLLMAAGKRLQGKQYSGEIPNPIIKKAHELVNRTDIEINPLHNRVSVSNIRNLNNWSKGFDCGYPFWEQGDILRKNGDIEGAVKLFDKARYNGYCAPVLFESYAKAYHKLKDFDNEIDILDEGIEREKQNETHISLLKARRDKAVQLLYKQQEAKKKEKEKWENDILKAEERERLGGKIKRNSRRTILQLTDELILIKKYETIAEAVKETCINSKSIRDAAMGVQKHAGGFIWKYQDENQEV